MTLRFFLFLVVLVAANSPVVFAQDAGDKTILERLNRALIEQQQIAPPEQLTFPSEMQPMKPPLQMSWDDIQASDLPDYGIVVRDSEGKAIQTFGAIPYTLDNDGSVFVAGYDAPEDSSLEIVAQQQWLAETTDLAAGMYHDFMKPIVDLPGVVTFATDYLADELCGNPSRPSSITLVLMVSASGSIFFVTAGGESGSEVSWEFGDVCARKGLE